VSGTFCHLCLGPLIRYIFWIFVAPKNLSKNSLYQICTADSCAGVKRGRNNAFSADVTYFLRRLGAIFHRRRPASDLPPP
jgi:hypothetical protein